MLSDESDESDEEDSDKLGSESDSDSTFGTRVDGLSRDLGFPLCVTIYSTE